MLGIDWPRAQPEANLFLTLSASARTHQKRGITSMYTVGAFIYAGWYRWRVSTKSSKKA